MLSIGSIAQSAKKAADYYTKEEKNYYLSEKGLENSSQWIGQLAKKYNLEGKAVEQAMLEQVLSGITPDGLAQVDENPEGKRRTGWDFTLSMPKSASIMALVYGDKRFLQAHDVAAKLTAEEIEKNCAQVRLSTEEGRIFQNTSKAIIAAIRHATSRENDPQVHTHLLFANMSEDDQGKIRAMSSTAIQKHGVINGFSERVYHDQKYYTAFYQSTFANIMSEHGIEFESQGNGLCEIKGFDEKLKQGFSKRTEQIDQIANHLGIESASGRDAVAKASRKEKQFSTIDELVENWQKEAKKYAPDFNGKVNQTSEKPKATVSAVIALRHAISHLGEVQTAFRFEKLMETALNQFGHGKGITMPVLNQSLEVLINQGELIPLKNNQLASKAALKKEQKLIDSVSHKTKNMSMNYNPDQLNKLNITDKNKKAIESILSSGNQMNVIDVKGDRLPLLESLIVSSEKSDRNIEIIAPNRSYLNDLTGLKAKHKPDSLFHWFITPKEKSLVHTVHQAKNNRVNFNQKLVVIDQAQRLSFDDTQKLIDQAKENKAKLIFINQTQTTKQVLKGDVIDSLKKGNVFQTEFQSQRLTPTKVHLTEEKDQELRYRTVSQKYAQLLSDKDSNTIGSISIMAMTNKEINNLTPYVREALKNNGHLSRDEKAIETIKPVFLSDAQKKVTQSFKEGMALSIGKQQFQPNYEITKIDHQKNALLLNQLDSQTKDEKLTYLKLNEIQLPITAFEKTTIKLAQGETVKLSGDDSKLKIQDISNNEILFNDNHGNDKKIPIESLKNKSISYNYINKTDEIKSPTALEATVLSLPSYLASKEVLGELNLKSAPNLHIITDNEQNLLKKFNQSKVRYSSVKTVLDHNNEPLTKTINSKTANDIKSDIKVSVESLKEAYQSSKMITKEQIIDKAVGYAISYLSDCEAAFRHQDVVKIALNQAIDEYKIALHPDQVNQSIEKLKAQGDLLSVSYSDGTRWVTKEAYQCEKEILKVVGNGKNNVSSLLSEDQIKTVINDDNLTKGQKEAITLISSTKDRFVGIQGLAGTGKSTMLNSVQGLIGIENAINKEADTKIQMIGLAPTHQAVDELREKGLKAQTSQSLLQSIDRMTEAQLKEYKNSIFVLDEASMVTNQDMLKLTKFIEKNNLRAVPMGDIKQIKAIGQGKPFEVLQQAKTMNIAYMNDIIRQKVETKNHQIIKGDAQLHRSVYSISEAKVKSSLNQLKKQQSAPKIEYKDNRSIYQKVILTDKDEVEAYIKKNVISTAESKENEANTSNNNDQQQNKKSNEFDPMAKAIAYKKMIEGTAYDYLSRTEKTRENTLLIAYSHKTRDDVTEVIRAGLKADNTLKNEHNITRLRAINLRNTEKRMNLNTYQKGAIFCEAGKTYYAVKSIDDISRTIELQNLKTNESKVISPEKINQNKWSLFEKKEVPLAENDLVTMRKTDAKKGYKTNDSFKVSEITKNQITLSNKDKTIHLSSKELEDNHWDYNYVKTTNSAQGATAKYTIGIDNPESPLVTLTRLYVDISRATDHYRMYTTEDKKLLLKALNNDGDKYSALETLREFITDKSDPKKTEDNILFAANNKDINEKNKEINAHDKALDKRKNTQIKSIDTTKNHSNVSEKPQIKNTIKQERYDKDTVLKALNDNCENVVLSLLGNPNEKHSDSKVWAFGNKTGSLRVTVSGAHRGLWRDWSGGKNDHGNLLSLIMKEEGLDFKSAIKRGAELAYVEPEIKEIAPRILEKNTTTKAETFQIAERIWKSSKPLKGTKAEAYLKDFRGISDTDSIKNIRFNQRLYSSETKQNYPGLVASITDKDNNFKGVEIIYLDKESNQKADLRIQKRSFGNKASFGIELQGVPQKNGISFLGEGIETTLSIMDSVSNENHVIAVSGKNNFTNIDPEMLSDTVVLCLDNDGLKKEDHTITETINRLEHHGKNVYTIMPNETKTDFNDLLKSQGIEGINKQIIHDISKQLNINDEKIIDKISANMLENKVQFIDKNLIDSVKEIAEHVMKNSLKEMLIDGIANSINSAKSNETINDKSIESTLNNNKDNTKNNSLFDYEMTL